MKEIVIQTPNRFLGLTGLAEKFGGCSTTTAYRISQSKDFPEKIKLPTNATGWYEPEVDAWILRQERVPNGSHSGSKRGLHLRGNGRRAEQLGQSTKNLK